MSFLKHFNETNRGSNLPLYQARDQVVTQIRETLLEEQGFHCAACGKSNSGTTRPWHLDHDHRTGNVRGVLCYRCNITLGFVRDDPFHLISLIQYLGKTQGSCLPTLSQKIGPRATLSETR
jgi:hypothetical protein